MGSSWRGIVEMKKDIFKSGSKQHILVLIGVEIKKRRDNEKKQFKDSVKKSDKVLGKSGSSAIYESVANP